MRCGNRKLSACIVSFRLRLGKKRMLFQVTKLFYRWIMQLSKTSEFLMFLVLLQTKQSQFYLTFGVFNQKRLLYLFCFMEKLLLSCRLIALLFAQCQPPSVRSRHESIAVGSGVVLVNKLSLGRTFSGRWCESNVTYECVVAIENFLHALFPSDSRKEKNAVSGN